MGRLLLSGVSLAVLHGFNEEEVKNSIFKSLIKGETYGGRVLYFLNTQVLNTVNIVEKFYIFKNLGQNFLPIVIWSCEKKS